MLSRNKKSRQPELTGRAVSAGVIFSALPGWFWLVGSIALIILFIVSLSLVLTSGVEAAPEEDAPLDCLNCHTRVLKGHDKLGSGSGVCLVCHDGADMTLLHLLDKSQISPTDSPQLCGQCHSGRYDDWEKGIHGTRAAVGIVKCADCHDPHQPQIIISDIPAPRPPTSPVPGEPLDCLSCHIRVLEGHDKLGEGSEACWACHYNMEMEVLHLAGGETRFPLSQYPALCGQCHQERYRDWNEGTHGVPIWGGEAGDVDRAKCINCHEPHQPQVALLNITRPHPAPTPPPPSPPAVPLLALGGSLLLVAAAGIAIARGGEGS